MILILDFGEIFFFHTKVLYSLFRNNRVLKNEDIQRNATKLTIFLKDRNQCSFFLFHFELPSILFFPGKK